MSAEQGLNLDFDVVLLHRHLVEGAWREMVRFEEDDFEVFAPGLEPWLFSEEIDRPSRKPVLIRAVMQGTLASFKISFLASALCSPRFRSCAILK